MESHGKQLPDYPERIKVVESPRPDESVAAEHRVIGEMVEAQWGGAKSLSADCCPECGGYVFNPEVNPGGASTITTASPTAQYCTLCGFTGHPSVFADHSCLAYRAAEILDEPNRFDPFEAL
ncbi:hypothetical protein LCGC14_3098440, partial [marine sediment metagenome]